MFRNVLVGIDGRAGGRDALALASRLADADAKLTLAHVQGAELFGFDEVNSELREDQRAIGNQLLEDECEGAAVEADIVTVFAGTPGRGLHERAEEQGADLIVVGSCSHGLFGRAMLGDDTREALNGTPCAVAVACCGYAGTSAPIRKIGVGYDGSAEAVVALAAARQLASERDARLSALEVVTIPRVIDTGNVPSLVGEAVDSMLEEATGRIQGIPGVEGRAVYGMPGEELAAFGDELDLLVVGSRNFGPVRRRIVGSTCDYLERHVRCSLLTLPRVGSSLAPAESATQRATTKV